MVHMLWAAFEEQQGKNQEIQLVFWDFNLHQDKLQELSFEG